MSSSTFAGLSSLNLVIILWEYVLFPANKTRLASNRRKEPGQAGERHTQKAPAFAGASVFLKIL
jgi:hypothetical protein